MQGIALYIHSYIYIPVCGRFKEVARVDNLVIPQCVGLMTSYVAIQLLSLLNNAIVKFVDLQL